MYFKGLFILAIFGTASWAHADFEQLTVSRQPVDANHQKICVRPFPALKTDKPQCVLVTRIDQQVANDSEFDFTEINLEAIGLEPSGQFGASVEWKGKGSGLLSIAVGGRVFALGHVEANPADPLKPKVTLEYFSDERGSEQNDRAQLMGEVDAPERLHVKTEVWLESVLSSALGKALNSPEVKKAD